MVALLQGTMTMNNITHKYTKEELLDKGIWIIYIFNPSTFAPVLTIYSVQKTEVTREFKKETTFEEMNNFIDEWVDKILIKKRKEKIIKLINKIK
jgi:hypothetical protein